MPKQRAEKSKKLVVLTSTCIENQQTNRIDKDVLKKRLTSKKHLVSIIRATCLGQLRHSGYIAQLVRAQHS